MEKRVLILQTISQPGISRLRELGWEVAFATGLDEETLRREAQGCPAIIVRTAKITGSLLEALPELKIVCRYGVGFDNIDVDAATRLGIWVTNVPASNTDAVAEGAIAMMLQLGRKFGSMERYFRAGGWIERSTNLGSELTGKKLGVIGMGRIGRSVCRKARLGLDMEVYGYDPYVKPEDFPEGVTPVEKWDDIFAIPDFVSIHMAYTGEHVVGKRELALMRPEAFLLNLSRGGVVDEPALVEALESKQIAGAGLDVFWDEPPAKDHPLLRMDQVVCLPHITGMTVESFARSGLQNAESIEGMYRGEMPECALNHPAFPRNMRK